MRKIDLLLASIAPTVWAGLPQQGQPDAGPVPHNHAIRANKNGAEKIRSAGLDKSTVATRLRYRGYRTAYFGKYINNYSMLKSEIVQHQLKLI